MSKFTSLENVRISLDTKTGAVRLTSTDPRLEKKPFSLLLPEGSYANKLTKKVLAAKDEKYYQETLKKELKTSPAKRKPVKVKKNSITMKELALHGCILASDYENAGLAREKVMSIFKTNGMNGLVVALNPSYGKTEIASISTVFNTVSIDSIGYNSVTSMGKFLLDAEGIKNLTLPRLVEELSSLMARKMAGGGVGRGREISPEFLIFENIENLAPKQIESLLSRARSAGITMVFSGLNTLPNADEYKYKELLANVNCFFKAEDSKLSVLVRHPQERKVKLS